jgi:hypothetical protein
MSGFSNLVMNFTVYYYSLVNTFTPFMKNAAVGQHLLSGQSSAWASHGIAYSDFSGALSGFAGAILLQPRK